MKTDFQVVIPFERAVDLSLGDEVEFDQLTATGGKVLGRFKVTEIVGLEEGNNVKVKGFLDES